MPEQSAPITEAQITALGKMIAIIVATLHAQGDLNGRNIAQAFRLNAEGADPALMKAVADLVDRAIEQYEMEGPLTIQSVK